jgi:c-di-GMP-binding flagellar brake protein YcgR
MALMANASEERKERRRHVRIKTAVAVELQLEKQAVPLRARTTDLSLGGCYVEMMFTLEVGTKVKLTLWIGDAKVNSEGIVVSRKLRIGNGIKFTGMDAKDSARLKQFLAILR